MGEWWTIVAGNPHLMHYAWSARVSSLPWEWDKHKYQAFQAEACPQIPWSSSQGLFPHPPMPSELTSKARTAFSPRSCQPLFIDSSVP